MYRIFVSMIFLVGFASMTEAEDFACGTDCAATCYQPPASDSRLAAVRRMQILNCHNECAASLVQQNCGMILSSQIRCMVMPTVIAAVSRREIRTRRVNVPVPIFVLVLKEDNTIPPSKALLSAHSGQAAKLGNGI